MSKLRLLRMTMTGKPADVLKQTRANCARFGGETALVHAIRKCRLDAVREASRRLGEVPSE